MDFENWCRLCAKQHEASIMIFGAETASLQLQSKLNKYLLIEVEEDDKLPKTICAGCCKQLNEVCQFIDQTRKAQETLLKKSLIDDHLASIEKTNAPITPVITKITYGSLDSEAQLTSNVQQDVVSRHSDVTYFPSADGENVTLTRCNTAPTPEEQNKDQQTNEPKQENHKEKPFLCKTCDRRFLTELALKNHTWSHVSHGADRPYVCTSCDKQFVVKSAYLAHFTEHKHLRYCRKCKRTFRTDRNMKLHMEIHNTNKSFFTCNDCGRSYPTRSSFKNHIICHSNERPYQCNICKYKFKRRQELRFHLNKHTGAKPFKCPVCDKGFSSSGNCYSHRIRMHPETRKDNNKSTRTATAVTNTTEPNTTTVPKTCKKSGLKKYTCYICSQSFQRKENYVYHIYKHTGVKPYHCLYCEEKFVTKRGMNLHIDKSHPGKDRPLALLSSNIILSP